MIPKIRIGVGKIFKFAHFFLGRNGANHPGDTIFIKTSETEGVSSLASESMGNSLVFIYFSSFLFQTHSKPIIFSSKHIQL